MINQQTRPIYLVALGLLLASLLNVPSVPVSPDEFISAFAEEASHSAGVPDLDGDPDDNNQLPAVSTRHIALIIAFFHGALPQRVATLGQFLSTQRARAPPPSLS